MNYQINMMRIGAFAGFLCVSIGAFGAHGLEAILMENKRLSTWETGVFYHCFHSLALIVTAWTENRKVAKWLTIFWGSGILIFSGSLYILSLTNIGIFGAITPVGGILFLSGWVCLMVNANKLKNSARSSESDLAGS